MLTQTLTSSLQAYNKSHELALMPPPQSNAPQVKGARMHLQRPSDATDAPMLVREHLVQQAHMTRAFSLDSGISDDPNHVHIDGYDTVMYEIESEAEAQEFLSESESDTGTSARARGVTGRKTKSKKAVAGTRRVNNKGAAATVAATKGRRGIRRESADVDVVNDS